ncbi:MAG: Ig-like domain-containing protein [Pedobacter sp.]
MKTINMMIEILISLVWMSTASAMDVSLQWDPNTESDLAGYKVYYGIDDLSNPIQQDVNLQTDVTISGLNPDRNYSFAVVAYNTSGLESSFSNVVKILETVSPVVSITGPANNAKISNTVSITANASDNVGVTKLEFYLDGILKATETVEPYQYSWNTLAVSMGTHTIIAKAYDAVGNVDSSTVSVNVVNDVTPPVITNITPINGSSLSGVVKISVDAHDDIGVTMVEFYANGTLLFVSNVAPYTYNWNTMLLPNSSYALTAVAYDNAGNIGQFSNGSVMVFNDTTAPMVTTFKIPTRASSTTVAISSFTATDNVAVTGYLITESATTPAADAFGWTASAPTSFTFSTAGNKTAYAWVKDSAGNVSAKRYATVNVTTSQCQI